MAEFNVCVYALRLLLLCIACLHVADAIRLWDSANDIESAVPDSCKDALAQDISCHDKLITASEAASGAALVGELANGYCTDECHDSIEDFRSNVEAGCGNATYFLFPNSTLEEAPLDLANGISWAYKLSCIKDCDGFCLANLYEGSKDACSDCMLTYGSVLVSFDAGRARLEPADFSSRLTSCRAGEDCYPWEYTPPAVPAATAYPSGGGQSRDCSGCWYTVTEEDTCECISLDASVGTDNMIIRNSLDYHCHDLTPGMELCLDDICELHQVTAGETCDKIIAGQNLQLTQLVSWNPTIHSNCDNLDTMVGRYICISPPGAGNFTYQPTSLDLAPTLTSHMFSSWTVVPNTTTLPYNTTSWYYPILNPTPTPEPAPWNDTAMELAQNLTKYCWITDDDYSHGFSEQDLPDDCQSLISTYCIPTDPESTIPPSPTSVPASCTPDRSVETSDVPTTTGSAPIMTPTPVQDGMVSGCSRFYYVQSGDSCSGVSSRFGISLDLFYTWNPDVGPDRDCDNLQTGTYACVGL